MPSPSSPVLDIADVVELEQRIAASGTSLLELMQHAGAALNEAVHRRAPQPCAVCVLCGSGNNGGDGWVAGGLLAQDGYDVTLIARRGAADLRAEPAHTAALHALRAAPTMHVLVGPTQDELEGALGHADVAIDALLGTGFSGDELKEPYASWVDALEDARQLHGTAVIAADVPSGISAQTGKASEPHVDADETVTMMVLKPGLLVCPGASSCGEVYVASICDLAGQQSFLQDRDVRGELPARKALARLQTGAKRYLHAHEAGGDVSPGLRRRTRDEGQHPYAIILTCSDSRVIPEAVFSAGIGELFAVRVAGNTVGDHQLGAIEYALEHLGCRLVVVLGHTHCGAVDAALAGGADGYIKYLVDEIRQAIGEETDEETACILNARHSAQRIEEALGEDADLRGRGIRVVSALYHIGSGRVEFHDC